ncbi:CHAT domain-containing tetratricopeptide repeat protein [Streptomyces griseosporeus]|uniref:CHAT domain-containing tetratricopeptide repeat protein n=1 Tax=Streptomyces griseosporeus TaxID=1910 RepID=UPI0036CD3116
MERTRAGEGAMRDERLAAVIRRMEQIAEARDPSLSLNPGALADARQLSEGLRGDDGDIEARFALGWLHWYRYLSLPEGQDRRDLAAAAQAFVPCFLVGAGPLPDPLLPELAELSTDTGAALLDQALDGYDVSLTSAAVQLWQRIVAATPAEHPDRAAMLTNLGTALRARFEQTGELGDLDEALSVSRQAVRDASAGLPERAEILSNLAKTLYVKFKRTGALADLDEAIDVGRQAVRAAPPDHPDRAANLSTLGNSLRARFDRTGALVDLEKALAASRQAVSMTPMNEPRRPGMLSNLALVLATWFERTGNSADLDEAINIGRQVRAAPAGPSELAGTLSNLATHLRIRFERFGMVADLDEAVQMGRQAVGMSSVYDSRRPGMLSGLGTHLRTRFERTGMVADLDEAVEMGRQAVRTFPMDHRERPAALSNLALTLMTRFQWTGALVDLEEAIDIGRQAVGATSKDQPERAGRLSNLGGMLRARFQRTGVVADLDEAVQVGRQAVRATPTDHPQLGSALSNLVASLQTRFKQTGELADLDEAVEAGRQAVRATPRGHPDRPGRLSNLSLTLRSRFERTGVSVDLDEAVECGRQAVDGIPDDHPERAALLFNLGGTMRTRFQQTRDAPDADEALGAFSHAVSVTTGAPSMRIQAARKAAELAADSRIDLAVDLLQTGVRLLPRVAPRQLHRSDQQHALGGCAGLAGDAAALLLSTDQATGPNRETYATQALQILESGRAVLISQALETRNDLTELRRQSPGLADRFTRLRDQLDRSALAGERQDIEGKVDTTRWDRDIRDRHLLATQFDGTVAEIRELKSFRSFMLPPKLEDLVAEARQGPIVVFNVSSYSSDALLLTADGVGRLLLPELAHDTLIEKIDLFHGALHSTGEATLSWEQRAAAQDMLSGILEWLWDAAAEPVLEELGFTLEPPAGAAWPRLWWVPGGLLGQLPLHAAGYHRQRVASHGRRTVMDRVISSYVPTVRALRHARQPAAATSKAGSALIVAMPTTPGENPLHHVATEAEMLRNRLPSSTLLIEESDGGEPGIITPHTPTKNRVLTSLPEFAIVHFACHGTSDPKDPSQSRLLLHDHENDPLTVASLAPIKLDRARLAYLSACRTALAGATDLIDESIHLASAFQVAGFRHVVGTLWEVDDAIAARIAAAFYSDLQTSGFSTENTAQALHHAVRGVRDGDNLTGRNDLAAVPSLWAAHLHAGA